MTASLDPAEVAKFAADAPRWWDPEGPFKPLHQMTPVRMGLIRDALCGHFGLDPGPRALAGLAIADLGCGGGLASVPLARLGATVTGLDAGAEAIAAAQAQARALGLDIAYRQGLAEALAAEQPGGFDAVVALEIVEHVADLDGFIRAAATLLRPGGLLMVTTINRTAAAYALAIVAAEQVLRLTAPGSHHYDKLVTPDELAAACRRAGLDPAPPHGMSFRPLTRRWTVSDDLSINYFMAAAKP